MQLSSPSSKHTRHWVGSNSQLCFFMPIPPSPRGKGCFPSLSRNIFSRRQNETRVRQPGRECHLSHSKTSCQTRAAHGTAMKATETELNGALGQAESFICRSPSALGACGKTEIFLSVAELPQCGCSAVKERIGVCLICERSWFALHCS